MRQKFLFCFSALPSTTDQNIFVPFTSTSPIFGHRKLAPSVEGGKRQTNFSTHDLIFFSLSFLVQFHAGVACAAVVCLLPFFTSLSSSFGIHSVCLSIYLFIYIYSPSEITLLWGIRYTVLAGSSCSHEMQTHYICRGNNPNSFLG